MSAKSILITGCSSGIGESVAAGLKARGHRVIASARGADQVARLQQAGFDSVRLDLNDSDSIRSAVEQTRDLCDGRLDALFNNAGFGQYGAVEDLSRAALRAQFETNLFGLHELTATVLAIMRRQGHGRIIQNSSVLGLVALPFRGAYNASKFALEALTDTLRLELAGTDIKVSLIEPGPIRSHFGANALAAFNREIDRENSPHRDTYRKLTQRLASESSSESRFRLPPEAVLQRVVHALESPRPRIRYYVTTPTYAFAFLRRVLPYPVLDRLLRRGA